MRRALKYLGRGGENVPLHLSFDIDVLDASLVHATGTRVRHGLSEREVHHVMQVMA